MPADDAGSEKKDGLTFDHVENLNTEGLPQLDVIQELDEQLVVAEGEEVISAYTITLIFVILCYPEPAGLSLDETSQLFTEGFGVRKAAALRKAKKQIAHQRKMLDVAV